MEGAPAAAEAAAEPMVAAPVAAFAAAGPRKGGQRMKGFGREKAQLSSAEAKDLLGPTSSENLDN